MRYLSVLIANILVNVPTVLLVLMYAHLGTFAESASLGIALAYVAPLFLFFSMQHGVAILGNKMPWQDAIGLRIKLAPIYLGIAVIVAVVYREWLILAVACYRLGDLLYEPYFYEKMRESNARKLLTSTASRLLAFVLCVALGFVTGAGPVVTVVILSIVNLVMSIQCAGSEWQARTRQAMPKWGDFLMGGAACLASLSVNVPRYFLVSAHEGDLAAYSNILTIVMAGTLLFVSFNNLFFSRAARGGSEAVLTFFVRSMLIGILVASLAWVFVVGDHALANVLVRVGLGRNYLPYAPLLSLFWVFYCALYLQNVANCLLIYTGSSRYIFISNALLIVFLVAGFLLLPGAMTALRALIIVIAAMVVFLMIVLPLVFIRLRDVRPVPGKCAT